MEDGRGNAVVKCRLSFYYLIHILDSLNRMAAIFGSYTIYQHCLEDSNVADHEHSGLFSGF